MTITSRSVLSLLMNILIGARSRDRNSEMNTKRMSFLIIMQINLGLPPGVNLVILAEQSHYLSPENPGFLDYRNPQFRPGKPPSQDSRSSPGIVSIHLGKPDLCSSPVGGCQSSCWGWGRTFSPLPSINFSSSSLNSLSKLRAEKLF